MYIRFRAVYNGYRRRPLIPAAGQLSRKGVTRTQHITREAQKRYRVVIRTETDGFHLEIWGLEAPNLWRWGPFSTFMQAAQRANKFLQLGPPGHNDGLVVGKGDEVIWD